MIIHKSEIEKLILISGIQPYELISTKIFDILTSSDSKFKDLYSFEYLYNFILGNTELYIIFFKILQCDLDYMEQLKTNS